MKFPTKYDRYGHEWLDKISIGFHPGVDFNYGNAFDDEGQDVVSITEGIVTYAKFCQGWGNHILIYHPKYNVYSHYAHLKDISVKENEKVNEGQLIGHIGTTGNSTAPHLHFEVRIKDFSSNVYVKGLNIEQIKKKYVNPEEWIKEIIEKEKKLKTIDLNLCEPWAEKYWEWFRAQEFDLSINAYEKVDAQWVATILGKYHELQRGKINNI